MRIRRKMSKSSSQCRVTQSNKVFFKVARWNRLDAFLSQPVGPHVITPLNLPSSEKVSCASIRIPHPTLGVLWPIRLLYSPYESSRLPERWASLACTLRDSSSVHTVQYCTGKENVSGGEVWRESRVAYDSTPSADGVHRVVLATWRC